MSIDMNKNQAKLIYHASACEIRSAIVVNLGNPNSGSWGSMSVVETQIQLQIAASVAQCQFSEKWEIYYVVWIQFYKGW